MTVHSFCSYPFAKEAKGWGTRPTAFRCLQQRDLFGSYQFFTVERREKVRLYKSVLELSKNDYCLPNEVHLERERQRNYTVDGIVEPRRAGAVVRSASARAGLSRLSFA